MVNNSNRLNPWDSLIHIKFSNPKDSSLARNGFLQRMQAAVSGTFYDLGMIPAHAAQALVKAPVALIRAIILKADPSKGEEFLKNWSGKACGKHLYRFVALIIAVLVNPFVSLVSPAKALHLHLELGLISGKYKKELEKNLKTMQTDFSSKLEKMQEKIVKDASFEEAAITLTELQELSKLFKCFQNMCIPAAKVFYVSYQEQLDRALETAKESSLQKLEKQREKERYDNCVKLNQKLVEHAAGLKERVLSLDVPGKANLLELTKALIEVQELAEKLTQAKDVLAEDIYLPLEERMHAISKDIKTHREKIAFQFNVEEEITKSIEHYNGHEQVVKEKRSKLKQEDAADRNRIRARVEEIVRLRTEKKANKALRKDPDHVLARRIAKGMLAIDLGVALKNTKEGIHPSYYIKSVNGKPQGVFKPQGAPSIKENILKFFQQGQRQFLNPGFFSETCAEKAADIIARELHMDYLNVPPVKILKMLEDREEGAFLVFAKKVDLAKHHMGKINGKTSYSEEELNIFQSFVIFDFLLGNLDRHDENWMVEFDGEIKRIVPIDNANSFPQLNHGIQNVNAWQNQYAWKRCSIAKLPFTEKMKAFVRENVHSNNIERIITKIISDPDILRLYGNKLFLTEEAQTGLRNRAAALMKIIHREGFTPEQLAGYWNDDRIQKSLQGEDLDAFLTDPVMDGFSIMG